MTDTTFTDGVTPIVANWLNEVNDHIHHDTPIAPSTTVHAASVIANTPAGNIIATNIQAAINELDSEKQPIDATLTALAGTLTAANKIPYATALDTAGELNFLIDGTLAANSDTAIPSQKAVKTYVDTQAGHTSGIHTFTVNSTTNVLVGSLGSPSFAFYTRIGNFVLLVGTITFQSIAAGVCTLRLSIPIASNFTGLYNISGTTTAKVNATGSLLFSTLSSNAATDDITFSVTATDASQGIFTDFSLMYQVL